MVKLADLFNARVSINLNPRNFQKAAFHCLQKIANQMSNGDFYGVRKAYDSVCGEYHSEIDKRWIVDVDKEDMDKVDNIVLVINKLHDKIENKSYKILAMLPSKSGMHIVTNPFNLKAFSEEYPLIEIHKNNPSNLFIS